MASDIKLDDDLITLEAPHTRVTGDLTAEKGLYIGKLSVQVGGSPQYALHEIIPELLTTIETLQAQLAAHHAIRDWNVQPGWRWCEKCRALFHGPSRSGGVCPVDKRPHTATGSGDYHLPHTRTRHGGQTGWRWCDNCSGLYYGQSPTAGRCPATGGEHNRQSGSSNYFLVSENSARDFTGQNDWRWCRKCEGCFYGPQAAQSTCPAGGNHDGSASGDYVLDNR